MLKIFKKRRDIFLQRIQEQTNLTLEGVDLLLSYMINPDTKIADQLTAKEKEADEARRLLIDELNRTFITPFDREDIFALSRAIDDILDYAYSTMTEIVIFKVKPTEYMVQICQLLKESTFEMLKAVECLQDHPSVTAEHANRAKKVENKIEHVYREALANMFKDTEDLKGVVKAMKMREVYRHLSNAADRSDEAANVLADIVVKSS